MPVLHLNNRRLDLAGENGSCQHLQTYRKEKCSHTAWKTKPRGEKKKKITSHSRFNITKQQTNTQARTLIHTHIHYCLCTCTCTCTHQHILAAPYLCLPLAVCGGVSKKVNSTLQLSPPACSPDGGLFKSVGMLQDSWIIQMESVTQPSALFSTSPIRGSLVPEEPPLGSVTLVFRELK